MRIVGGLLKGRILMPPKGKDLRPTADRVRESIFNVLIHGTDGNTMEGSTSIDVFCGTGALGFEAISRGSKHCVFIDINSNAIENVKKNARSLGLDDEIIILKLDAQRIAQRPEEMKLPAEFVFLDPPYNLGLAHSALLRLKKGDWLAPRALCIIEVAVKENFNIPKDFSVLKDRNYGATRILFLRYDSVYEIV